MKPKFSPEVYAALRDAGMTNRQMARELGVNEASVRRGLAVAPSSNLKRLWVTVLLSDEHPLRVTAV
jgi:hypothetical protein